MEDDDSAPAGISSRASDSELKLQGPPIRTLSSGGLRRAQRLCSSRDFQRVRTDGRRVSGGLLTLGYAAQDESRDSSRDESGPTRIGFSVSRRVGNAVVRNRVKRRLREVVRAMMATIAPGYDLVLTARPSAAEANLESLAREVQLLLRRARLLIQ